MTNTFFSFILEYSYDNANSAMNVDGMSRRIVAVVWFVNDDLNDNKYTLCGLIVSENRWEFV